MVSYNSSNLIKSRFIDWKPYEYDHTYTMRSVGEYMQEQQSRKELAPELCRMMKGISQGLSKHHQSNQEVFDG